MKNARFFFENRLDLFTWDVPAGGAGEETYMSAANVTNRWKCKPLRTLNTTTLYLRADGIGRTVGVRSAFLFGTNLQESATVTFRGSNDGVNWTNIGNLSSGNSGERWGAVFDTPASYRRFDYKIVDNGNPDGYLQVGRVWGGPFFEPKRGCRIMNSQISDLSQSLEGPDGQAIAVVFAKREKWDVEFSASDQRDAFDEMYKTVGISNPIVFLRRPADATSIAYTDIGKHCRYCRIETPIVYRRIAGEYYMVIFSLKEEG